MEMKISTTEQTLDDYCIERLYERCLKYYPNLKKYLVELGFTNKLKKKKIFEYILSEIKTHYVCYQKTEYKEHGVFLLGHYYVHKKIKDIYYANTLTFMFLTLQNCSNYSNSFIIFNSFFKSLSDSEKIYLKMHNYKMYECISNPNSYMEAIKSGDFSLHEVF